jgi:hypothetical protein
LKKFSCKNALKETGSFVAAITFFAVCMCVCFIGAYAAEDSGRTANDSLKIVVKNAEITAKNGISGDCKAEFSDDTVGLSIDGFAYPGAYAQINVTVYNDGTLTAVLDEQQQVDCDIDGVSVSFPQIDNGEKIEPGEQCELTLVVKWDGNSQNDCSVSESGDFSMKLIYSAEAVPDESSSDIADSSVPDESSSEIDESSVTDESSDVDNSSSQTESTAQITDSGSSSQTSSSAQITADVNANTGVFSGKNMLLALSAAFAMCAAMCAVQLYNAKKNGDETDK